MWGGRGVEESRCGGVAVWGSLGVEELRCGEVVVWRSHGVGQLQCRGVTLWRRSIMWGLQWLPSLNSLCFSRFSYFPPNLKKTNYFKNSLRQNLLHQLICNSPLGKYFSRVFLYQNQPRLEMRGFVRHGDVTGVFLPCRDFRFQQL